MLVPILVGAAMSVLTVGIHALGTGAWITRLKRQSENQRIFRDLFALRIICMTALALLGLHTCEVMVWAVAYSLLPNLAEIHTFEDATYFSTVTYTALGYGDVVIRNSWRMLAAIQAMTGLLIFGWSTALFFAVFQQVWLDKRVDRERRDIQA